MNRLNPTIIIFRRLLAARRPLPADQEAAR